MSSAEIYVSAVKSPILVAAAPIATITKIPDKMIFFRMYLPHNSVYCPVNIHGSEYRQNLPPLQILYYHVVCDFILSYIDLLCKAFYRFSQNIAGCSLSRKWNFFAIGGKETLWYNSHESKAFAHFASESNGLLPFTVKNRIKYTGEEP